MNLLFLNCEATTDTRKYCKIYAFYIIQQFFFLISAICVCVWETLCCRQRRERSGGGGSEKKGKKKAIKNEFKRMLENRKIYCVFLGSSIFFSISLSLSVFYIFLIVEGEIRSLSLLYSIYLPTATQCFLSPKKKRKKEKNERNIKKKGNAFTQHNNNIKKEIFREMNYILWKGTHLTRRDKH